MSRSTPRNSNPSVRQRCQGKLRRQRIPEHLPVTEQVLDPPEVLADPSQWRRIGEEVREQLDYKPGRFLRIRLVRGKYVRKG